MLSNKAQGRCRDGAAFLFWGKTANLCNHILSSQEGNSGQLLAARGLCFVAAEGDFLASCGKAQCSA